MNLKIVDIRDEMTPVAILIQLRTGQTMWLKVVAKIARDIIQQWRKYLYFAMLPEDEQKKVHAEHPENLPLWNYHFLEGIPGDEEANKNIAALVCFRDISAIQYSDITNDQEKQEEYLELLLKKLKSELKDDAWKDKT